MATLAETPLAPTPASAIGDERFFLRAAIVMALIVVAGFSFQLGMGRSTFASPLRVHAHAIAFMGWVAIYVAQNVLVATGRMALHRRLGWIAAAWMVPMIVLGCLATAGMVRAGRVPFFFRPLQFLVFDPMILFTFVGLTTAAILMRRRTEWHRRLHYCGMSILIGPGISRLLPSPLLQPWAWETVFLLCLIFPLVGIRSDIRRSGRAHPAWRWGISAMLAGAILTEAITYSPVGMALYRAVTAGSPGAAIAPLEFAPPPARPLVTGRR
ncbi:MAG TPA: hypothetical protein VH331_07305 [Allosphingosinicella sp.]|jgi:hypothetical protein|nr:hypothetical protein [Allosphingosinicella sp.]